ncbi:hypothetical protein M9Y10_014170 [Tritrichomonas musculus]|uniref:Pyridoxal-dependent decarboxylase n=1 Tax=Tritrichomonas musculus TaxID=1915356 RepID=A0ABR2KYS9_9EUKA
MQSGNDLLKKAYTTEDFDKEASNLMTKISQYLQADLSNKAMNYLTPDDQLDFWRKDFATSNKAELLELFDQIRAHSLNFHSKGYVGHQVAITLPITVLTSAFISYLNNSTTIYEVGMVGNAMEKVVIEHMAEKFGYVEGSTGIITSGGSLSNLTALVTARTSSGIQDIDYYRLAVMVSEEAHYSVSRAASIMGIRSDNIIKVPVNKDCTIKTELLEQLYQDAISKSKIIFCIVGCACTTSVGAYDDFQKIGEFAEKHQIWFHIDAAHGGPVIFSQKYKHLLNGVNHSDSISVDFHKMMMTPSLSTLLLYNKRNHKLNEFSPKADYLWQEQLSQEWHHSALHTIECTKPLTIIHTYAIMRIYGDEIYAQNVNTLYDMGHHFAELIKSRKSLELALEPCTNIVCFRYRPASGDIEKLNRIISDRLLKDGTFYVVSTTVLGQFYLRVSLMNPLTNEEYLIAVLDKIVEFGREVEAHQNDK